MKMIAMVFHLTSKRAMTDGKDDDKFVSSSSALPKEDNCE